MGYTEVASPKVRPSNCRTASQEGNAACKPSQCPLPRPNTCFPRGPANESVLPSGATVLDAFHSCWR